MSSPPEGQTPLSRAAAAAAAAVALLSPSSVASSVDDLDAASTARNAHTRLRDASTHLARTLRGGTRQQYTHADKRDLADAADSCGDIESAATSTSVSVSASASSSRAGSGNYAFIVDKLEPTNTFADDASSDLTPSLAPASTSGTTKTTSFTSVVLTALWGGNQWTHRHAWLHRILILSAMAFVAFCVVAIPTRTIAVCYGGWAWHYTNRCETSSAPHPWLHIDSVADYDYTDRIVTDTTRTGLSTSNLTPEQEPTTTHKYDPSRIAIALVVDHFLDPATKAATIENKRKYAKKWGYTVVIPDIDEIHRLAPGLPVAWAKFPVIKHTLETHDFVFMIDADAVFMRDDISLREAARQMEDQRTGLLISNDLNGPNSGVFMMRRSEWTFEFLDKAMDSARLLSSKTPYLPLRFENRAFMYLLDAWPTCANVRRADALLAPVAKGARQRQAGVTTVDRCLINRHPQRATGLDGFFDAGAGFDETEDAFIVHAAGGDVAGKTRAMHDLLATADEFSRRSAAAGAR